MKLSVPMETLSLLSLLALSATADVTVPDHHPSIAILSKFSPHFKCPYAEEWVTKGPKQAALDLGLWKNVTGHNNNNEDTQLRRRRAQQQATVAGSCTYTNTWTGQPACLEMRGDSWTAESMETRCSSETDSTLTTEAPCALPPALGGWCLVGDDAATEATPLALAGDCAQTQTTCETFMGGTFEAAGECGGDSSSSSETPMGPPGTEGGGPPPFAIPAGNASGPISCAIAPGAVGAGHQAAFSMGYSPVCEGTPAEGSPYMWPMAWASHIESKSMAFGSDDVWYHQRGKVHYRLDKNWKRADTWYQRGVQRSIGQAPCPPENRVTELSEGPVLACRRDSDEYTTMIHRGSKMMFISWKNGTEVGSSDPAQISECNWLDLQIVGNIRPDWYMDDRGDSTDVQYLGDQHVFHENQPRLVKQWRKQDFADQYFVMSMLANPKEDGIHWPMILNVPGEGFGDDFLQIYTNQSLLSDDDDYLFLLDEALEAMNGTCQQMDMGGGAGPPTGQVEHIPSNLEVEPNAWFSNVYTFSPVWEPPIDDADQSSASGATGMAMTETDNLIVQSCYDESAGAVELSIEFTDFEMTDDDQIPWMAMGYRETDECLMNPRGGGDAEIILLTTDGSVEASPLPHHGFLPSAARSFDGAAVTSIYESLTPLGEKEGYSDVHMHVSSPSAITKSEGGDSSMTLHFKQAMGAAPEVMHLMYAIGSTVEVGYHKTRACFEITEFPICPSGETNPMQPVNPSATTEEDTMETTSSAGRSTALIAVIIGAFTASFL